MLFFLALLFFLPVGISAILVFDRLIWLEYNYHRCQWENDGRPQGFLWVPPGQVRDRFGMPMFFVAISWLFGNPVWIEQDQRAGRLRRAFRVLMLAWNFWCIAALMIQLVFFGWGKA